jgi:uncharacterized membrane protein
LKVPFFSKKDFFSSPEKQLIVNAIRDAEQQTSGEIRVYVESHCRFVDPLDRAAEVFWMLKMDQTREHNGVLVYVAIKDKQLALFGDKGIHEKVGDTYWKDQTSRIISHMKSGPYADAISKIVLEIGEALRSHFPYDGGTDKNELPDDIVMGR